MKYEGSLPYSKESTTGPYFQPYKSSLHHISIRTILILVLPFRPRSTEYSLSCFRPIFYMSHLSHSVCMPHLSYFARADHRNDIWRKIIYSQLELPVVTNGATMTSLVSPAGVPQETSSIVARSL
jgi:hypothetical protein